MGDQEITVSAAEFYKIGNRYRDACIAKLDFPPEVCQQIYDWTKEEKDFLVFEGNPGIGKTYLAAAICNQWHKEKKWVRYFTANSFLQNLREAISNDFDATQRINYICECPYLILDDFGANLSNTDWQKEMIFHTIDVRYCSRLPTLILTNLNREIIATTYTERTASRLYGEQSTLICIQGDDKRKNGL